MRPRGYFAVFVRPGYIAVCHGYHEARRLSPCRSYKSFKTRLAAEEYAAWWLYDHPIKIMGL